MAHRSVLLVDDDRVLLRGLTRHFREQGWEASAAPTYREALALAVALKPSFAVVDEKLPDGDGLAWPDPLT